MAIHTFSTLAGTGNAVSGVCRGPVLATVCESPTRQDLLPRLKVFLSEEIGTMNATFPNGVPMETGVPSEIHASDELRFGVVQLRFLVS